MIEFFPKVPRLNREIVVTEKIDGTNAGIVITPATFDADTGTWEGAPHSGSWWMDGGLWMTAISRNRVLDPRVKGADNYGFAAWAYEHTDELVALGPGTHHGEWWGLGIQRGYGLHERRFSLFHAGRWIDHRIYPGEPVYGNELAPACCHVVPILYTGKFSEAAIESTLRYLKCFGSFAEPAFADPEGVVIYHTAARQLFKRTFNDEPKAARTNTTPLEDA